jgi:rhamnulokinase
MVTAESFTGGFSNEQGLGGTTCFLRSVAGMWLLQECRRQWRAEGTDADFATLVLEAGSAAATMVLHPDAADFAKPCDMPAAIRAYARKTGQRAPSTRGEFTRTILESLATRYRVLLAGMRTWMPDFPAAIHVVGGGSQNALLNQMTADATGLAVVAGPVEATAAGSVLAQLMATGHIRSLEEGRAIIRASFEPRVFEPRPDPRWDGLAEAFSTLPQ